MTQHTPGPWTYHKGDPLPSGNGRYFPHVHIGNIDESGFGYLTVNSGATTLDQCDANAALIAAAPEQNEEMKRFLPVLERAEADPEIWAVLTSGLGIATLNGYRAAIAKAEAQS